MRVPLDYTSRRGVHRAEQPLWQLNRPVELAHMCGAQVVQEQPNAVAEDTPTTSGTDTGSGSH